MLTARVEIGADFGRAARSQIYKMASAGALAIAGGVAAAAGISAATSIFATLAGTTGYSIAIAIAGMAAFGAGAIFLGVAALNYKRVKNAWKTMDGEIDRAVSEVD